MNRLNEFLENLDKKNLIMLYVSILIICFIIVYYVYQDILLPKKELLTNQKISLIKKIRELRNKPEIITVLRRKYKNKKIKVNEAKEDLRYLKELIYSTPRLNISQKEYLNILDKYIQIGSNINASFIFNETKKLNKYNIEINGKFSPVNYFEFVKFLKTLQKPNAIVTINDLLLNYDNVVNYDINLSMWSFK